MDFILPEGFEEKIRNLIPNEWEDFKFSYENNKFQSIRLNTLKYPESEYSKLCCKLDVSEEPVPWEKRGHYYDENSRPGKHPFHEMGLYYIQEPSAMSAASLLAPEPGMRVLDLCAAPGGKSTQLAAYLSQEGLLVSNEINNGRCKILSSNIERLGIRNAIVTNEDSEKLSSRFPAFFHAILVDAPCSGEGMFRKNPEAMNEWSPQQVLVCAKRQREILNNAANMLMPGGCLVYSTCTFSREENEDTVISFLQENEDYTLEQREAPWFEAADLDGAGAYRLWPHKINGEGHFVAVFRKAGTMNNQIPAVKGQKKNKKVLSKDKQLVFDDFLKETFGSNIPDWICPDRFEMFGEQLYVLPDNTPNLAGVHVLRAGLNLGEFKKNRFEPSHALALTLGIHEVQKYINLSIDDNRAYSYFNGESIFVNADDSIAGDKGWCLVCIDGYSAGWGKIAGGQVKNHYPKGLRKDLK